MNRPDSNLQVPSLIHLTTTGDSPLTSPARLIVVIPDAEEEALLAGRIAALAKPRGLPVILLGVAPDSHGEPQLRRKLVTIAAFLRDDRSFTDHSPVGSHVGSRTEIHMEQGRDWLGKIKSFVQPDDLLACHAEQSMGTWQRLLSDILATGLNVPVYTFTGLQASPRPHRNPLWQLASWLGSLASIGGFLMLQARIVAAVQGSVQILLLLLTLFGEVGVIWVMNSLLNQA